MSDVSTQVDALVDTLQAALPEIDSAASQILKHLDNLLLHSIPALHADGCRHAEGGCLGA